MSTREPLNLKPTIHYLQTLEWKYLKSEGLGLEGLFEVLNDEPLVSVVGHISSQKPKRFSRKRRVLEIFFGPYFDLSKSNLEFEAQVLNNLVALAKRKSCQEIRHMAYVGEGDRYFSLGRLESALKAIPIPYAVRELETSIYDLDLHIFGELNSASRSSRKNLRHAAEIQIIQAKSEGEIKQYFKELSRIKGRQVPEERELEANAKYSSHRFLFLAQKPFSGECVGTLGFIHDNYMAVEIASSTLKGPEMRGVQEKLHLHAFDMAKKSGLKKFDLAGLERESGGDWNSIAKFKLKFGGTIVKQGIIDINICGAE